MKGLTGKFDKCAVSRLCFLRKSDQDNFMCWGKKKVGIIFFGAMNLEMLLEPIKPSVTTGA